MLHRGFALQFHLLAELKAVLSEGLTRHHVLHQGLHTGDHHPSFPVGQASQGCQTGPGEIRIRLGSTVRKHFPGRELHDGWRGGWPQRIHVAQKPLHGVQPRANP